jgi:hypothetical protein
VTYGVRLLGSGFEIARNSKTLEFHELRRNEKLNLTAAMRQAVRSK